MPLAIDIAFKWGGKKPPEEEKKDPSTSESTRPSDSTKTDETTNSMSSDRQPESTQADSASSTAEKKKQQKNKETQKTVSTSEKKNSEAEINSKESTKSTETETLTTEDDEVSKKSEAKKKELNENVKPDLTINLVEKLLIQRRVIIFRHGERMDRVFPSWIRQSNSNGSFRPYNSNQPKTLPKRRGGLSGYDGDPPITEIGKITAQLSAKSLKQSHQKISAIYSSPAFRCIETAQILAKESGNSDLKIKIEYGLFDCCNFYEMAPTFFTTTELLDAGFLVAKNYPSIISKETFYNNFGNETKHDFYRRSHDIIHKILSSTLGTVIIVGHAATLDSTSRALIELPKSIPSNSHLDRLSDQYPYCTSVVIEQSNENGQWRLGKSLLPITFLNQTTKFDKQFLLRK